MFPHSTPHPRFIRNAFAPAPWLLTAAASLLLHAPARAAVVPVGNASFEAPNIVNEGVATTISLWNDAPNPFAPAVSDEQWDQATGIYYNYPGADYHPNMDGNQAAYIFMSPLVELSQDLAAPEAKFTIGLSYRLTVGIIGAGGGMPDGTTMRMSLYYRDAGNARQTVSFFDVVMSQAAFPDRVNFRDFTFSTAEVKATDAWAGKNIGILFSAMTVGPSGYYDLDNVRLTSIPEPASTLLGLCGLAGLAAFRRRPSRA